MDRFIKKALLFGIPGCLILAVPITLNVPVAIPFFIPVFAILISIPLVELLTHLFPDFFMSSRWRSEPSPTFSLARALKMQHRYDEAIDELDRMIRMNPQDADGWLEKLELILIDMKDLARGESVYREALSVLDRPETRRLITVFYTNITGAG
ncbi:bacterial transcriptional activator domain-containing protein [bacterium]|nr:bacterial transcriptional activator domain-containing protein [candidate division CSSED10-310 bacterium]